MEALSLHAAPILSSAQEFPEATQPPVNCQLAVAEILDERPPEKEGAVAERLVAVKAQILQNQRECGERGTDSVGSEIEEPREAPVDNTHCEPESQSDEAGCLNPRSQQLY